MTDYIKQVAEAVRSAVYKEVWNCNRALAAFDVDLDAVIASVPKPEYDAYLFTHIQSGDEQTGWTLYGYDPEEWHISELYAYPPDARAEIERLKAAAAKREAFIDELVAQRHAELMIAATRGWALPTDDAAESIAAVVEKIEQERGE